MNLILCKNSDEVCKSSDEVCKSSDADYAKRVKLGLCKKSEQNNEYRYRKTGIREKESEKRNTEPQTKLRLVLWRQKRNFSSLLFPKVELI